MAEPTTAARAPIGILTLLRPLLHTAMAFDVDLLGVAAAAGLTADHFDLVQGHATPEQVMDVLNLATAQVIAQGKPAHFPIALGQSFSFDHLGHFATYLATSATLRDTVDLVHQLIAVLCPIALMTETKTPSELRFALSFRPTLTDTQRVAALTEAVFAAGAQEISAMTAGRVQPVRVTFAHRAHARAQACQTAFACPVEFDRPQSALVFARADFDLPLSGHIPALHQQARREVELLLDRAQRGPSGPVTASDEATGSHWLERRIFQLYDTQPALLAQGGVSELAAALGMPQRTLQRRLETLGTTHRQLVADLRVRKAKQLLANADLRLDDVARQLGFSDGRSFAASFKRWTGFTPRGWRQN